MKVDIKGYAQCWRDLSKNDCRKCLSHGVKQIEQYCRGRRSKAQFLSDNCVLTYVMTVSPGSPSKSEMAPLALKQYPEDHGNLRKLGPRINTHHASYPKKVPLCEMHCKFF